MPFKDLFFSAVDSVVPKVNWNKKKMKHWFSHDAIQLIFKKHRMYHRIQKFRHLKLSPPPELLFAYKKTE